MKKIFFTIAVILASLTYAKAQTTAPNVQQTKVEKKTRVKKTDAMAPATTVTSKKLIIYLEY